MKRISIIICLILLASLGIKAQHISGSYIPFEPYVPFEPYIPSAKACFTKEDYRASSTVAPTCTAPLSWNADRTVKPSTYLLRNLSNLPLYLLVVDQNIYPSIRDNLNDYAQIIANKFDCDVFIVRVNPGGSAIALRERLQSYRPNLFGCFFIGDVPYAEYQIENEDNEGYNTTFPCDLFFMDLDGEWVDQKRSPSPTSKFTEGADGKFERHFGNVQPEIFIGRLPLYKKASYYEQVSLVNQYLKKVSAHWCQSDGISRQALMYINKSWSQNEYQTKNNSEKITPLKRAGFEIDIYNWLHHSSFFSFNDYLSRLNSSRYSYVNLWCHSGIGHHEFETDKSRTYSNGSEFLNSSITPIIYNLFCCSALRWTDLDIRNGEPFLAGSYIYGSKSNALAIIGSTKVGSMLESRAFHDFLAQSISIGEAYMRWWNSRNIFGGVFSDFDIGWYYGLTIIGDPLVRLVNPIDLYMQDAPDDDGSMPNSMSNIEYNFWESQDIWIRNQRDGGTEHQNPVYKEGKPVYVYARIRNRGTRDSKPGATVSLRWSQAGISLDYDSFLGKNTIGNNIKTGGLIGTVTIPTVAPGESVIVCKPWFMENPNRYKDYTKDAWHYCMLAEIESPEEPISTKMHNLRDYVKTYNNVAMKNIYNIEVSDDDYGLISGVISIHNPDRYDREYEICIDAFKKDASHRHTLTSIAEVSLIPNRQLMQTFSKPQVQLNQLRSLQTEHRLIAQTDNATIDRVRLGAGEQGLLNVKFNFKEKAAQLEGEYVCRVVLKDKHTGANVGGETYIIKKCPRPRFVTAIDHELINGKINLSAKFIDEPAIYRWRNVQGELLHEGNTFSITPTQSVKLEVEAKVDGVKGEALFEGGSSSLAGLLTISPNPAKDYLDVKVKMEREASLIITSVADGCSYIYPILKEGRIDVGSLPRGKYLVSLFCKEEMYDEQVIILE